MLVYTLLRPWIHNVKCVWYKTCSFSLRNHWFPRCLVASSNFTWKFGARSILIFPDLSYRYSPLKSCLCYAIHLYIRKCFIIPASVPFVKYSFSDTASWNCWHKIKKIRNAWRRHSVSQGCRRARMTPSANPSSSSKTSSLSTRTSRKGLKSRRYSTICKFIFFYFLSKSSS